MSRTIAVFNFKGGVGKTTCTLSIASSLAKDMKVLVIDFDPQCNLTNSILSDLPLNDTIFTHIRYYLHNNIKDIESVKVGPGLFFIPGDFELSSLDSNSQFIEFGAVILQRIFQRLKREYDLIFIDCPTSFGKMVQYLLASVDNILVPLTPDSYSLRGALKLIKYIKSLDVEARPRILGLFFNRFRKRLLYHQKIRSVTRRIFGSFFIENTIRNTVRISENSSFKHDISPTEIQNPALKDFDELGQVLRKKLMDQTPRKIAGDHSHALNEDREMYSKLT